MPSYVFYQENVRDGGTDVTAGQDLSMQWEAECDTSTVDAGDIIAALASVVGIAKGSPHPTYLYARCTTLRAVVEEQNPFRWKVTAQFQEPRPAPGAEIDPSGGQPEPPDRTPMVRGGFRVAEVFRGYDEGGKAFVNSAGDYLSDQPPTEDTIGEFTVTRYYESIDYFVLRSYRGCCNEEEWEGFPKHSLKIRDIEWEPHSERGWSGWRVAFHVDEKQVQPEQNEITDLVGLDDLEDGIQGGWHPVAVLDVGFYEMVDIGGGDMRKRPYEEPDGSGRPKDVPGMLDGIEGVRSDTPQYLGFDMHPRISFAILDP
jgi:hypothetical protein